MKIEVRDLHKNFGENEVLRGVDLELPEGEISVIVGGSGSGKSVLLKHLIGLMKPDSGKIFIDGKDIVPLAETRLFDFRRRVGMIFQSGGLLASLNVGENVALGLAEHRARPPEKIDEIVAEKLDLVHLDGKQSERPENLSGGMKKRVSIARALTLEPELILYDEPTAGLDPPMAANIDNLILRVKNELGVTSVVVTHDLKSVFKLADRVNMLHDGVIIESLSPEEFKESDNPAVKNFIEREMK